MTWPVGEHQLPTVLGQRSLGCEDLGAAGWPALRSAVDH